MFCNTNHTKWRTNETLDFCMNPYMMLIPGTCIKSNNVVPFPNWGDSSATYSQLSGPNGLITERGGRVHMSPKVISVTQYLVWHGLREWSPALLSLFQSVQDKLAGVDESLHTVNEAHFCPRVQLRARFIHTFLLQTETDPVRRGATDDARYYK